VSADTGMDQAYDRTWHGIGCDEGRASWMAVVDGDQEEGETLCSPEVELGRLEVMSCRVMPLDSYKWTIDESD